MRGALINSKCITTQSQSKTTNELLYAIVTSYYFSAAIYEENSHLPPAIKISVSRRRNAQPPTISDQGRPIHVEATRPAQIQHRPGNIPRISYAALRNLAPVNLAKMVLVAVV